MLCLKKIGDFIQRGRKVLKFEITISTKKFAEVITKLSIMRQNYLWKVMKACAFMIFFSFSFTSYVNAQTVSSYSFAQSSGTYTAVTGGSLLGSTASDDEYYVDPAALGGGTTTTGVGFPIGFNFTYNGTVFNRIGINNNGWITFGQSTATPSVNLATTSAYTPLSSTATTTPTSFRSRIAAIGRDLAGQTGSELRVVTTGATPNQVCVIQWTNFKRFGTTGTGDNLNVQIRLNEGTNVINVVYGAVVFGTGNAAADVGLGGTIPTDFNNRTTTTNWNATTAGVANTDRCTMVNTVTAPASGLTFSWTPPPACSGTPTPGNTLSTSSPACSGVNFTLSLQNNPSVSGLSYQWQSSPDGVTYTNIPGATSSTYTTSQTATTYYRANVICSGNTGTSTPIQITMAAATSCYCIPGVTSCASSDVITNVTLGTINNTTACSTNGYGDYFASVAPTTLGTGVTYPMTVTVGPGGTEYVAVWIDYNQNGTFDASEFTALGSANGATISSSITVPAGALAGTTRMRVRVRYNTALTSADPCLGYTFGETEDYKVTISLCTAGAFTVQPANQTTTCTGNATFTTAASGTAITYQWQESTNGGTTYTNITNGGIYSGATTAALTLTNIPASYNTYRYRAVITGTCTAATNSNAAILTVNAPPAATVFPASPVNACLGTPQPISITTAAGFGAPVTVSFPSGTLNLAIPENVSGISHTVNVSGIPTGAVITAASVTLNISHTYVGDCMISLKAPNNNILNLDNLLSATNNPGANFVNTIIGSTGTTALSAGVAPFSALFKADGNTAATGAFGVPSGATGFAPNTPTFAGLYSVPNGPWTIAMYDAGPPDVGSLTNWTLNITYTPIVPYTGVFTPNAGLFLDAAGTVPYAGTSVSTVYAKPPASTTYTVTLGSGACSSPATTIAVTVNTPAAITTQPTNAAVCTDKTTSFTTVATGTGIVHHWRVSTAGSPYTDITNAGIYSGATTGTLTITAPPVALNGSVYRDSISGTSPCGAVVSNSVTLTVNPLPTVTLTSAPYTRLYPGLTTTITATSTPAAATYAWFRNGIQVAGATTGSYVVNVDGLGDYTVRVTDVNGCTNTSAIKTIADSSSGNLFIYPNPNNGSFQVRYYSLPNNVLARNLFIYDAKGSRVYTQTFSIGTSYSAMNVDLRPFGTGTYWVELADKNGKRIKFAKVVVL